MYNKRKLKNSSPFLIKLILCGCQSSTRLTFSIYPAHSCYIAIVVTIALRIHLFSFRTQKLSSAAPKVLGGQPPGRIGCCHIIFLDSSAAEHPAVNRRVVGSNPTRGARKKRYTILCISFFITF